MRFETTTKRLVNLTITSVLVSISAATACLSVNANQKWHRFRKVDMTPLVEGSEGRGHRSEAGRGGEAAVSPDPDRHGRVPSPALEHVPAYLPLPTRRLL